MDFIHGGVAALMAITLVHPIDVVKSRAQFRGEAGSHSPADRRGTFRWLLRIAREEGARGLYRGLPAAYLLQFSVTATRFGTYEMAKRFFPPKEGSAKTGAQAWARNAALAALSGAVGALAGAPWFAIKTRHQVFSTSEGAVGTQHVPKPALKEFAAIARTEGLRGLFRGLDAFMPRVVVFGAVQLATYDVLKAYFADRDFLGSRGAQQVAASVGASLASVTAIQPFDFLAARMMNQPVDPKTGRGLFYSGPWDCAVKSIRAEGPWALFKGYPANLARFGPYTVLVLVFVERLRALEASLRGKDGG